MAEHRASRFWKTPNAKNGHEYDISCHGIVGTNERVRVTIEALDGHSRCLPHHKETNNIIEGTVVTVQLQIRKVR